FDNEDVGKGIQNRYYAELLSVGYARVLIIAVSNAGGQCEHGEQQDQEILGGLDRISDFLIRLHEGKRSLPYFPPLPQLVKSSMEQIEEEGGSEEVEAQLVNNGQYGRINEWANWTQKIRLNFFIEWSNPRPYWHMKFD
ncbi:MAG: hypothetical protein EZS28_015671, partial [Streblomastix strix]